MLNQEESRRAFACFIQRSAFPPALRPHRPETAHSLAQPRQNPDRRSAMTSPNRPTHPRMRMLPTTSRLAPLAACLLALAWLPASVPAADVKAEAPPGSVVLRHTRGGAYFVAEPLKEEYDKLLARVQALQADLDAERVDGADVLVEPKDLRARLDKLRADIDQKKVPVAP